MITSAHSRLCLLIVAAIILVPLVAFGYNPTTHTGCTDFGIAHDFLDRFAHPPFTPYMYDKASAKATPTPQFLRDPLDDFEAAAEIYHVAPRLAMAIARREGTSGSTQPPATPSTCERGNNPWGLHDPNDPTQTTCQTFGCAA